MSIEKREIPSVQFEELLFENINSHEQLNPEIVNGIVKCVSNSGMRTSEEDIMEHIVGDLVMVMRDGVTGEVVAFSSTKIVSPNEYFNVSDISDEPACYLQGATVSKNRQGSGIYKKMNEIRIGFGLEKGVDLVFTQTQNKSVLRGIMSTLDTKKKEGAIDSYEVSSILREGHYVIIEDMLPAGLESVNGSLKNTGTLSISPLKTNDKNVSSLDYYHKEYRDDRTSIFAEYLYPGVYSLTYRVRATTPGRFQHPPAAAYQLYAPDVSGHSSGGWLTVQ